MWRKSGSDYFTVCSCNDWYVPWQIQQTILFVSAIILFCFVFLDSMHYEWYSLVTSTKCSVWSHYRQWQMPQASASAHGTMAHLLVCCSLTRFASSLVCCFLYIIAICVLFKILCGKCHYSLVFWEVILFQWNSSDYNLQICEYVPCLIAWFGVIKLNLVLQLSWIVNLCGIALQWNIVCRWRGQEEKCLRYMAACIVAFIKMLFLCRVGCAVVCYVGDIIV